MTKCARTSGVPLPLEDSPHCLDEFGPIFIIGCPRSGTSFLSNCLAAGRDIEAFNGLLVSPRLLHFMASQIDRTVTDILLASIRDVFWQSFWRRRFFRNERVSQLFLRNCTIGNFLGRAYLESSLFLYKEPFASFICEDLARYFTNAKFLHIIRDGRDTADSMERSYPDALSDVVLRSEILASNKNTEIGVWRIHDGFIIPWWIREGDEKKFIQLSRYERCVLLWREMTICGRSLMRPEYVSRYLEIRYEELVESPVEVIGSVLKFMGRHPCSRITRRALKARRGSAGVGLKRQTDETIKKANIIAGKLLLELGYEL